MSFHAHVRQLNAAQQSKNSAASSNSVPPLEEQNFKVKIPCSGGHAPWPEGICTKCQPSAITLQRQVKEKDKRWGKKSIEVLIPYNRLIVW